jgi:hypothetical protein
MHKELLLIAALLIAGPAYCESPNPAAGIVNSGIAADLGTTAIGLSMGAAEANPLGLAVVPLKFWMKTEIDKIPDENRRRDVSAKFAGVQFGAAAANLCTLAVANPALAALCFAGGMAMGYNQVKSIPTEMDCFNRHLAQFEEAAATGRMYRVSIKTCIGHFEEPRIALNAGPDLQLAVGSAPGTTVSR